MVKNDTIRDQLFWNIKSSLKEWKGSVFTNFEKIILLVSRQMRASRYILGSSIVELVNKVTAKKVHTHFWFLVTLFLSSRCSYCLTALLWRWSSYKPVLYCHVWAIRASPHTLREWPFCRGLLPLFQMWLIKKTLGKKPCISPCH